MDLLNSLRNLAEELYTKNNNEKYQIIKEMLLEDKCFFMINSITALALLNDLGFSDEEALEMYEKLISPESYKEVSERIIVK